MLYRARLDLTFLTEDDCIAFINLVEEIKPDVYKGKDDVYGDVPHVVTQEDHDQGRYLGTVVGGTVMVNALITPGDGLPVTKSVDYHECRHDENPPQPCGNYSYLDIDDPVAKEHKGSDGKVTKYKTFNKTKEKKT